jgi:hypothetical protein
MLRCQVRTVYSARLVRVWVQPRLLGEPAVHRCRVLRSSRFVNYFPTQNACVLPTASRQLSTLCLESNFVCLAKHTSYRSNLPTEACRRKPSTFVSLATNLCNGAAGKFTTAHSLQRTRVSLARAKHPFAFLLYSISSLNSDAVELLLNLPKRRARAPSLRIIRRAPVSSTVGNFDARA